MSNTRIIKQKKIHFHHGHYITKEFQNERFRVQR